jgi:uncharacterized membrane protein YgaE (UPF0421/DUF939 family)
MNDLIGLVILIIVAALVYWVCEALHLPYVIAVIAALLVLLVGFTNRGRYPGARL